MAALLVLALPAGARADAVTLDGNPLNVYADGLGEIQVRPDGQADGLFYPPDANPAHAGLEIKEGAQYYPLQRDFDLELGRLGADPPTVSGQGTGTQVLHSSYYVGPDLKVSEDITYVDGTNQVPIHYGITNNGLTPTSVRVGEIADLYVGANDNGNGVSSAGPPRFVGGRNQADGTVVGLQEVTPWAAYQEGDFGDGFADFSADGLNNTVDSQAPDNGAGVQFALNNLAPGETRGIDVLWLVAAPPPGGTSSPGPLSGSAGASNNNPSQLPPPVAGKTVNLHLANGTVLYEMPGSKVFKKLTSDVQVPLGTTLDTTHGRVTLISAADLKGTSQHAWFYDGVFKVGQTKGAKPITDLSIPNDLDCPKAGKAAASAKKPKSRKLWGDGSGNFRTRGNFSSATVRGTKWVVIDTCAGTLTRVVRGVVAVHDEVRHKTILLKANQQYLAHKKKK